MLLNYFRPKCVELSGTQATLCVCACIWIPIIRRSSVGICCGNGIDRQKAID